MKIDGWEWLAFPIGQAANIFRGELLGFREGSWTIFCFTSADIGPKHETISGMGKNQNLLEG